MRDSLKISFQSIFMTTQTNQLFIKPAITIEIAMRTAIWFFLCSSESLANQVMRYAPPNELFYAFSLSLAIALFVAMRLFGDSALVSDIRELCFYDILIQLFGLLTYLIGLNSLPIIILAYALIILKGLRLLWTGKNTDESVFTSWPVFGFLGYLKSRMRLYRASTKQSKNSKRHDNMVYLCIVASLPLGYLVHVFHISIALIIWVVVPLLAIGLHANRYVADLVELYSEYLAKEQALATEKAAADLLQKEFDVTAQALEQQRAAADALQSDNVRLQKEIQSMPTINAEDLNLVSKFHNIDPSYRIKVASIVNNAADNFPLKHPPKKPLLTLVENSPLLDF
jgi:hypothetical protein